MGEYFCLKTTDVCGTVKYIDIPGGNCEDGVELTAYPYLHGGSNQQWRWHEGRIVSSISPKYCLAVKEITASSPLILQCRDDIPTYTNVKWVLRNGIIKLESNQNFYLALNGDKILLRLLGAGGIATRWETPPVDCPARPASSCHLQYGEIPQEKLTNAWTLENTVCVRTSASCTYFCVVGWGPGGYSGIQQIDENRRVAIFSMWNDGANGVREIAHGENVNVTTFGGEGTGLKAMKDIYWKEHQKVTFRVSGEKHNNVWRCSCWYLLENGAWDFIASYERSGNPPFNQHFYSFIEDWNRGRNCDGHIQQRCAEFIQPKVMTENGETIFLREAMFTRQSEGDDEFAHRKAFGGVHMSSCFLLSTGGDTDRSIFESLAWRGCEQRSNNNFTKLFV